MKKKHAPRQFSQPNPTTVKDPRTDGYSVVVHPCQDIQLFLTDPVKAFKNARKDDEWSVTARSDFFRLDAVSEGSGRKQYNFVQYYDLSSWTSVSSVYLGEIEISVSGRGVQERFSLCVTAKPVQKQQFRIITAVNPAVSRIKLDLDEILEVVVPRQDPEFAAEEVWCSLYDTGRSGTGNGSQWFEKLRQETLILPGVDPQRRDRNSLYFTMARSVAALPRNPFLHPSTPLPAVDARQIERQHHFWFRVRPEDKAAVIKANDGRAMANVVFNGKSGDCSNVQVLINTRGQRPEPKVPKNDRDRHEGSFRGLVGRYSAPSSGLLVNPGKSEATVELTPGQDGIVVELAPPHMTWPHTSPAYRWTFGVEPVMGSAGGVKALHRRLECLALPDRQINQQAVQRFLLKPKAELTGPDEMLFLGVVNFVCGHPAAAAKAVINCVLVKERSVKDVIEPAGADRFRDFTAVPSVKKDALPHRTRLREDLVLPPVRVQPQPKYDKVVVKITEIRTDSMSVPDCKVVPFLNVKFDRDAKEETCCIVKKSPSDYGNPSPQKKNEWAAGTTGSGGSERSGSSDGWTGSQSGGSSLSPRPNPKFSGGNGSVGGVPRRHDELVLVNPPHDSLIEIRPHQELIIRLPVDHWDMKNDVDYFWCFNSIGFKSQQFFVRNHRLVRDGRRLYQEFTVSVIRRNTPRELGNFILGGIRVHNAHEERYISVRLVVENIGYTDSTAEYMKCLRELMQSVGRARNRQESAENAEQEKRKQEEEAARQRAESAEACRIVRDPTSGRVLFLTRQDTVRLSLPRRPEPAGDWLLDTMPGWIKLKQTSRNQDENVWLLAVDHDSLFPESGELHFACGEEIRTIGVRIEYEDELTNAAGF